MALENQRGPTSAREILVDINEKDITKSVSFEIDTDQPAKTAKTETHNSDDSNKPTRRRQVTGADRSIKDLADKVSATDEKLDRLLEQTEESNKAGQVSQLETKIAAVRGKIRDAKKDEDVDLELELMDELVDLRADLKLASKKVEKKPTEKKTETFTTPQLASDFMRQNSKIFNTREFHEEREIIKALDRTLAAEGLYSEDSEDYYAELVERVNRRIPELEISLPSWLEGKVAAPSKGSDEKKGSGMRSQTRGTDVTKPKSRIQNGKVSLTLEDQDNMRRVGLDPSDPKHARAYADNLVKMEN